MARIRIEVYTTIHGAVINERVFDETFIEVDSSSDQTTCVADALLRASKTVAAAHGEAFPPKS